jgi:hypothetical protein
MIVPATGSDRDKQNPVYVWKKPTEDGEKSLTGVSESVD